MASKNGAKHDPAARRDALTLLTDPELKAALERKRDFLRGQLADIQVDKLMPYWAQFPPEVKASKEREEAILLAAIEDIDRRLAGASDILRAFGVRETSDG